MAFCGFTDASWLRRAYGLNSTVSLLVKSSFAKPTPTNIHHNYTHVYTQIQIYIYMLYAIFTRRAQTQPHYVSALWPFQGGGGVLGRERKREWNNFTGFACKPNRNTWRDGESKLEEKYNNPTHERLKTGRILRCKLTGSWIEKGFLFFFIFFLTVWTVILVCAHRGSIHALTSVKYYWQDRKKIIAKRIFKIW